MTASLPQGHVNGARYYIIDMKPNVIKAKLATGTHKGKILFIPRILFHPKQKGIYLESIFISNSCIKTSFCLDLLFEMERKQFPIRPCFGITSNKSQGNLKIGTMIFHMSDKIPFCCRTNIQKHWNIS